MKSKMKSRIWMLLILLAVLPGVEGLNPELLTLGGFDTASSVNGGSFYVTDFTSQPSLSGEMQTCNTFVVVKREPVYETCFGEVAEFVCEDAAQQICEVKIVEKEHQCQVDELVYEEKHTVCRDSDGDFLRELQ